jgi:hypothetical protein
MTHRFLLAPVLAGLMLASDAAGAAAQDEKIEVPQGTSIRWRAFTGSVEIPRAGREPYVLKVEIPEQEVVNGRVRVLLRGPNPEAALVSAYGRFSMTGEPVLAKDDAAAASGSDVAMESLQLVAEGLRIDPPSQQAGREDSIMIIGYNHEITSPRDAAPVVNAQIVVPLPEAILKALGG